MHCALHGPTPANTLLHAVVSHSCCAAATAVQGECNLALLRHLCVRHDRQQWLAAQRACIQLLTPPLAPSILCTSFIFCPSHFVVLLCCTRNCMRDTVVAYGLDYSGCIPTSHSDCHNTAVAWTACFTCSSCIITTLHSLQHVTNSTSVAAFTVTTR